MSTSNILLGSSNITLRTGLISWWDFNGNLNDSHGSNTLGTVLNSATTSYIAGLNNQAFYIDGSSTSSSQVSYLDLASPVGFSGSQPFTFGGWFKIIGTTGTQGIFNMSEFPLQTTVPVSGTSPVTLTVNASFTPTLSASIDLSTWRLIVYKYAPGVGGTLYYPATNTIVTGTSSFGSAGNQFSFGIARGNNAVRTGDTAIDSSFVWQRLLSDSEITQLYNGGAGLTYADT